MLESMMREYIELIDTIQRSRLQPDELQHMDSERLVLHEQILELLGKERREIPDMYAYCQYHLRDKV